uniref:Lysosomal-associated transmembrane protein 4B n=2 Tax=Sus scrofa TaxID=9823 RepID=A0A8D0V089_PIG
MKMVAPWTRFYSNSCCLCCHVRTGTILLGVWYLIINAVVLLILLSALADPDQYHFSSSELGGDFEFMDDANMCIAIAISLLMILICAMATYGAYKQHAAWIIPFFCYQIFDFALNTLVAITILVYPNSIQEYIRQLPPNFPYKDDIMAVNPTCLVLIILLFISIMLTFKGYLISCVWNCYRYINGRNSSDVLVYVTSNDTTCFMECFISILVSILHVWELKFRSICQLSQDLRAQRSSQSWHLNPRLMSPFDYPPHRMASRIWAHQILEPGLRKDCGRLGAVASV